MADIRLIDNTFDYALLKDASCAFGVFDGVHRGHRFLIEKARAAAQESTTRSVILTFDCDPDELFCGSHLKKLMSNSERLDALSQCDVNLVAVLPFTREFSMLEPFEFLDSTFGNIPPAQLHVGSDFRFGHQAKGSVHDLKAWGRRVGVSVDIHQLELVDGYPVTSTRIRELLSKGYIEKANCLLGRPYSLLGVVEHGRGEGAHFGFRTANIAVEKQRQVLADGVYAAWVYVGDTRYKAAVNVGIPATFADRSTATCEPHLLDFDGNLYGCAIRIEFLYYLRPMRVFSDAKELAITVQADICKSRELLS